MRIGRFLLALAALAPLAGCGQSAAPAGGDAAAPPLAATMEEAGPAAAVERFLEAVRRGDDKASAAMLTPAARTNTAELGMNVAPPGSDTASFKVGEVEMIGDEGAHVASFWTDEDEEGNKHTDTVIWMVRKEADGWRIAGMATRAFEDMPAVIMNFEEPEDMLAKQRAIEEEMSRRAGDQEPATEEETAANPSEDTRTR